MLLFTLSEHRGELGLIETLAQIRVKSILDCIVGASFDLLGNVAPSVAVHEMQLHDEHIFLDRPFTLRNVWVQVVVPSLTTLLADTAGKALGDIGPIFGALLGDNSGQDLVLVLGPSTLRKVAAVVQLEPAV